MVGMTFILNVRFLRFLIPDDGEDERGGTGTGSGIMSPSLGVLSGLLSDAVIVDLKGDKGIAELGDSGEDEGEGSVNAGESNVELLIEGDECVESEALEVVLPRWW